MHCMPLLLYNYHWREYYWVVGYMFVMIDCRFCQLNGVYGCCELQVQSTRLCVRMLWVAGSVNSSVCMDAVSCRFCQQRCCVLCLLVTVGCWPVQWSLSTSWHCLCLVLMGTFCMLMLHALASLMPTVKASSHAVVTWLCTWLGSSWATCCWDRGSCVISLLVHCIGLCSASVESVLCWVSYEATTKSQIPLR